MSESIEKERLKQDKVSKKWKAWGPYLSERQWATVREDYTDHGNAWESVVHDQARSKAYRWGEDGIGGFSNYDQRICFSWAFWNEKDPILKERLFGLTGNEGNHGEDVKELYYYLDSTPTHSYMKMLYKYPKSEFPYAKLVDSNVSRSRKEREYELLDTGIFDQDEYYDLFLEYAKNSEQDFLFSCTAIDRGNKEATLHVLPTIWMRNTWSSGRDLKIPTISKIDSNAVKITHHSLGVFYAYFDSDNVELLFCDNETNRERIYGNGSINRSKYPKDSINDYVVNGAATLNPKNRGTKSSGHFKLILKNSEHKVRVRFSDKALDQPFEDFDSIMAQRVSDADEFYHDIQHKVDNAELKSIQRQAFAGMMWSKQFYYYNIHNWLHGDPGKTSPPHVRKKGRNSDWKHLFNYHVISMPDKWEYPWYAAWDLAFHCIPIARIDPDFAKNQLLLLLTERYQHPNGQIPAYEWNFSDVNPPVHAWAVLRVFNIDKKVNGEADLDFLQRAFHKLTVNFTWWINRKDKDGNNLFEGGFLGLDNIGVFDRNHKIIENSRLEQADSTSWMAMFALNMLRISQELSLQYPVYQDMCIKYFEHFLYISGAMNGIGDAGVDLWDEKDGFYYDIVHCPDAEDQLMKVRSMVGLIPLYAVEILRQEAYDELPEFRQSLEFIVKERPTLASLVSRWNDEGTDKKHLLSILRRHRLKKILERMLDPKEFLSEYGIRALSKYHKDHPYEFEVDHETLSVEYLPGESDSSFFGGNSNWRGPIWFPVNYILLESMQKYHQYYSDGFKVEYPTGSGNKENLADVAKNVCWRMFKIFLPDEKGNRPLYGDYEKLQKDPHFKDYILFYEYFNGDTGEGLGASHQTGWTGLVAEMIYRYYN